jgi:hypothetical protein
MIFCISEQKITGDFGSFAQDSGKSQSNLRKSVHFVKVFIWLGAYKLLKKCMEKI